MKLYPVLATGIRAYCSDVIVDPEGDGHGLFHVDLRISNNLEGDHRQPFRKLRDQHRA